MNELRARSVEDVLIVVCDGLTAASSGDDATFELPQRAQQLDRYSLTNPGRISR